MKQTAFLGLILSTTLGLVSFSSHVAAKEYYKWVDANGSTHYTTTPPPKNAKRKGSVETYGWSNSAPTQSHQNTPNETPNTPQQQTPQDQQQPAINQVAKPTSKEM